ncbi:MAG: hypothetical protein KGD59_06950 [Candidatus Heimdallarchaeota archaeon]|nr:hypothetical protein [Candidatus Heimdallarchaeota archaeon]MBY8994270.1 hypothetical protein [Candidatus Heimdallarchaeota archaeon]
MTIKIAWGITGAGCWLLESFEVLGLFLKDSNVKIDLFFSEAGREVAQNYGIFKSPVPLKTPFIDKVREIPHFNQDVFRIGFREKYKWLGVHETREIDNFLQEIKSGDSEDEFDYEEVLNDVIFEVDDGSSFPTAARAANNRYDFIVISPATGNTVAKIAYGIADNLITNLVIMGNKSENTEVIIVPTDFKQGEVKSYLPIMLHQETCKKCQECSALWACKPGAIRRKRGKIRINRLKCIGCLDCVMFCRHGIVTFMEETKVIVRNREAVAADLVSKQDGFTVLETPKKIYDFLVKKM